MNKMVKQIFTVAPVWNWFMITHMNLTICKLIATQSISNLQHDTSFTARTLNMVHRFRNTASDKIYKHLLAENIVGRKQNNAKRARHPLTSSIEHSYGLECRKVTFKTIILMISAFIFHTECSNTTFRVQFSMHFMSLRSRNLDQYLFCC